MLKRRKSWDFLIFWVKNWAMLTFFPLHIKKACDEPLISPGYTNGSKIVSWGLIEKEDCSTSKRGSLFRFLRERKIWNASHFKGNIPVRYIEMNCTSKPVEITYFGSVHTPLAKNVCVKFKKKGYVDDTCWPDGHLVLKKVNFTWS